MAKPRKTYKNRTTKGSYTPPLVVLNTIPSLGVQELISLTAFQSGFATEHHFCNLADARDILCIGAELVGDEPVKVLCAAAYADLMGVEQRYRESGVLSATDQELNNVKEIVFKYKAWFGSHKPSLFVRANTILQESRKNKKLEVNLNEQQTKATH